jgi:hypothetical protein
MGIGAIVLGVFALVCALAGALLFWVPFLGTMISFLAPVLALAGTILGGVALSRARAGAGESEGLAIGGLVTSLVALVPSMIVALTCGACNICATGMYLDPDFARIDGGPHSADAGIPNNGSITPSPYPMPPPFPTATPLPTPTGAPLPTALPSGPPPTTGVPPTSVMPTTSPGMPPPPMPPHPGT